MQNSRLKISHRSHTGRLRPHEYTSYFFLVVLLLLVGVALTFGTVIASPGPDASSVALSGTVPEAPPKTSATISVPSNGQHFSTSPITVSGTCQSQRLIELYKNNIFAGSTTCNNGSYSLKIDLLFGKNILVAKIFDVLNQPGPDSQPVTVYYDLLPPQPAGIANINLQGTQLLLNTSAVYQGTFPGQQLNVPIDIIGGTPPYAINVQWGDGNNKVMPRNNNTTFNATHTYQKPGTFQINIQATDSQNRVAFLTVAAIINGQPASAPVNIVYNVSRNKLLALWPAYTSAFVMVVSFWLGERREKKLLGYTSFHHQQHV